MRIGVLALQGSFAEHLAVLQHLGVETLEVRLPADLNGLDGLIIPGGESTTIAKLAVNFDLLEPLREFGRSKPIWGTCAGAIFLSKDAQRPQPLLELMDISVERNAFGRQVASFEIDLHIPVLDRFDQRKLPFHAVFIRAPLFEKVYGKARSLVALPDGRVVAAIQNGLLATAFHPELSQDDRFHRFFLSLVGHENAE
jgi:pyridoxal 5'-phosphate synthase pdxT subunit